MGENNRVNNAVAGRTRRVYPALQNNFLIALVGKAAEEVDDPAAAVVLPSMEDKRRRLLDVFHPFLNQRSMKSGVPRRARATLRAKSG